MGLARFESDSRAAESRAFQLGQRIGDGLVTAGKAVASFTALAGTAAVGVLAWADRSIKATAELHGLAEQTGVAASAIQSFKTASDTSGVSLDSVAKIVERLNVTLSKPVDENKGAGAALKAIGLNADQLRALKPDEQLELIAQKLAGFAEGAGRGAVAVTLLGKSGAAALPFLNDLAEGSRSQIKLTDEQIDAADRYSKASARTRSELGQLAQLAAVQMVPALNSMIEAFKETAQAAVGVDATTKTLGTSTAVATFAENAVVALGHVVDAGDGAVRVFGLVGKTVGGYAAVAGALLRGEVQQAKQIGAEFRADAAALLDAPLFSDRLAARLAASKIPAAADPAKPKLDFRLPDAAKATAAATASTAAYDGLIRSITAKTSAAEAELEGGEKLSEAQKFALQVVTQLAATEGKYTAAQKRSTTAVLEAFLAAENLVEAQREEAKWLKETGDENVRNTESLMKTRDAYEAQAQASRDQLALFGLTADQLKALEIARLRDAAAALEQKAAQADGAYLVETARLYIEQAAALRETADAQDALAAKVAQRHDDPLTGLNDAVRDYLDGIKRAGDDTNRAIANSLKSLEDAGVSVLTGGNLKNAAKTLVDGMLNEFVRLKVVRPLLADIFGGTATASASGSAIAGLFGKYAGSSNDPSAANYVNEFDKMNSGSSSSSGTNWLSTIGSFFAGFFADGGDIRPGAWGIVGENGPELAYGGGTGKTIVPMRRMNSTQQAPTAGSGTQVVNNHYNISVPAGTSRDTADQLGSRIALHLARANKRNN